MYTSFTSNPSNYNMGQSKGFRARTRIDGGPPKKEDLQADFDDNQLLRLNQRILDGKAAVTKVLNDTSFIIFHEDFRRDFVITKAGDHEDIKPWIKLQTHSNIVTAFDQFCEQTSGNQFVMVEHNNSGTMFNYIKEFGEKHSMDLAIDVPRSYIELVFDAAIQLATGLEFAHNNGLVHGQFDLSKVFIEKEGSNVLYKIGDFAPKTSMDLPVSTEANYWPFSKQKKEISDREKTEVIMLKDIYSLGIAILELMIGRTSKQKFHISLESLPLTWAEFPESTPLIQVLVECIQIDSITQRKGKLTSIRKLLIREYKKFFHKPFYKMEHPYVGKRADVFNKRGIVSLFHGDEGSAIRFWSEARMLCDRHFDSAANFCIYRWSTGRISDKQLMDELGQFVFDVTGKGETLQAYLLIATGEREEGVSILKTFIDDPLNKTQHGAVEKGVTRKNPFDLKLRRQMKNAEDVFNAVKMDKDKFPSNARFQHNHKEKVQHMSFCQSGGYFTSSCTAMTKLWKVSNSLFGCFCTISAKSEQGTMDANSKQLSTCDSSGTVIVSYRGYLKLHVYDVVEDGQDRNAKKRDTIDLEKEIQANGNQDFQFDSRQDQVLDMRFLPMPEGTDEKEKQTKIRIYMMVGGQHYFADVNATDGVTELTESNLFEDMSVLAKSPDDDQDGDLKQKQDALKKLILEQMNLGNELLFPTQDKRIVVVKVVQDPTGRDHANDEPPAEGEDEVDVYKHYMVFDINRESYIRKVEKSTNFDDCAAVNQAATLLIYHEKDDFIVKSIRVPNSSVLVDRLRPRFAVAENKLNPAQASLNRQAFKDKVYRELHAYHVFKEDPLAHKHLGLSEEQNIQLMVLRYEEAVMTQYKLKANRELMMLQKVLLRDACKAEKQGDLQKDCPLIGVEGVKRIEIYDDELKFASNKATIEYVQMSSEPHRHFFLVGMHNRVYKYDVVTKELLFSFHSDFNEKLEKYRTEQNHLRHKMKKAKGNEAEEQFIQSQLDELENQWEQIHRDPIKNAMMLWDRDDKLVCISEEEIRLWDFYDHKEQAPELLTLHQTGLKVEAVYINKGHDHEKGPLYICVTEGQKFHLYMTVKQRTKPTQEFNNKKKRPMEEENIRYTWHLETKLEDMLEADDGVITAAAFSKQQQRPGEKVQLILGTNTGKLITYNIDSGERNPQTFQGGDLEQSITQITSLQQIVEDEVFLVTIDKKEIKLYCQSKNEVKPVDFGPDGESYAGFEICNVAVASNNKFFMVAIPEKRAIGWFGLNRNFLTTKPLRWETKYQFKDLITDDHLSTMMLQNKNDKELDYHYILWKFDTDKIPEKRMLEKMDGGPVNINDNDLETTGNIEGQDKSEVEKVQATACCNIF